MKQITSLLNVWFFCRATTIIGHATSVTRPSCVTHCEPVGIQEGGVLWRRRCWISGISFKGLVRRNAVASLQLNFTTNLCEVLGNRISSLEITSTAIIHAPINTGLRLRTWNGNFIKKKSVSKLVDLPGLMDKVKKHLYDTIHTTVLKWHVSSGRFASEVTELLIVTCCFHFNSFVTAKPLCSIKFYLEWGSLFCFTSPLWAMWLDYQRWDFSQVNQPIAVPDREGKNWRKKREVDAQIILHVWLIHRNGLYCSCRTIGRWLLWPNWVKSEPKRIKKHNKMLNDLLLCIGDWLLKAKWVYPVVPCSVSVQDTIR